MILKALEVENYRNIPAARFEPGRELTVICGKNGQGKTNLLEAVWLLTGGKSFRGAKDAELIRENAGYAVAEGETQGFGKESRIRVFVGGQPGARKARTVHVNGVDYGRAANAAGTFTAVVFDPGHLSLVKGSPEGRRRFLDAALCQLYPGYVTLLRRYSRLVTQKNALLKSYWQTPDANGLLDVFDEKLAEAAGAQKITGEHPVMLLDDVLSELDETRQSYLLSRMEHRQTIVTACDTDLFRRTSGRVYRMEGGILHAL